MHRGYIDALVAVGALPVLVPAGPQIEPAATARWIEGCDALIVTGGGDVEPDRYGGEASEALMDVDGTRDAVEIAAVRAAMAGDQPVLGICRGIQLLAVATGGTLIGDVASAGYDGHWAEDRQYEPVHAIKAEPGSLAERALASATTVNSIHHQAVADPGPVLRPTAWAPDGLIEAIEGPGVLGIQWHPERLVASNAQHLAPFQWLAHG